MKIHVKESGKGNQELKLLDQHLIMQQVKLLLEKSLYTITQINLILQLKLQEVLIGCIVTQLVTLLFFENIYKLPIYLPTIYITQISYVRLSNLCYQSQKVICVFYTFLLETEIQHKYCLLYFYMQLYFGILQFKYNFAQLSPF